MTLPFPNGGLPDMLRVPILYQEAFGAQSVPGFGKTAVSFSMNNCYDPYPKIGNNSANYWNFWSQAYGYYHVNYATCQFEITPLNGSSSPAQARWVARPIRGGDTIVNDFDSMMNQRLAHRGRIIAGYGSNPKVWKIKEKASIWKLLGRKFDPSIDNIPVNSAGPNEPCWFYIWFENTGPNKLDFDLVVKIKYYVTFNKFQIGAPSSDVPGDTDISSTVVTGGPTHI